MKLRMYGRELKFIGRWRHESEGGRGRGGGGGEEEEEEEEEVNSMIRGTLNG
jgi:hypothetical protein